MPRRNGVARDRRMAGDRRAARAVEHAEKGTLAAGKRPAVSVIDRATSMSRVRVVVLARLDADRALPHRRQKFVDHSSTQSRRARSARAASGRPAPAGSRRPRRSSSLRSRVSTLPRSGTTSQIGPQPLAASPAGAATPCRRSRRAGSSATRLGLAADEARRAGPRAGRSAEGQAIAGSTVGMSLEECTARSIAPCEQRLLDLLGEQALAAGLRQRPVLMQVAGGANHLDLDAAGVDAMRRRQRAARVMRACASASGLPRVPIRRDRGLRSGLRQLDPDRLPDDSSTRSFPKRITVGA